MSLELVRRVPEFFLYALERGITELNVQLTQSLLAQPHLAHLVHLLAALTNFLTHVIVCYDRVNEDIMHVNVSALRETLATLTFPRAQAILATRPGLKFTRILLAGILESCYVSELGEYHVNQMGSIFCSLKPILNSFD